MKLVLSIASVSLLLTGCAFTDSALQYSYEGTKRVEAGYKAKAEMTKAITEYLTKANEGCGVKVEIINNVPVTTVKECVRATDVLQAVNNVEIIKPQQIETITDGVGDMLVKATNVIVPTASIYYGYKNNQVNQQANVAIRQSDNEAQTSMWSAYTGSYQNTSVTDTSNTSVTDTSNTSVTDTSNTSVTENTTTNTKTETTNETIPTISADINSTSIN